MSCSSLRGCGKLTQPVGFTHQTRLRIKADKHVYTRGVIYQLGVWKASSIGTRLWYFCGCYDQGLACWAALVFCPPAGKHIFIRSLCLLIISYSHVKFRTAQISQIPIPTPIWFKSDYVWEARVLTLLAIWCVRRVCVCVCMCRYTGNWQNEGNTVWCGVLFPSMV